MKRGEVVRLNLDYINSRQTYSDSFKKWANAHIKTQFKVASAEEIRTGNLLIRLDGQDYQFINEDLKY